MGVLPRDVAQKTLVFTFAHYVGTNSALQRLVVGTGNNGERPVLGQQYLVRQATTLLKFAKSVRDPNVSAALVEKAADLRDRVDGTSPVDPSPRQITPQVFIRRHPASEICDVVVSVRGQEIILRCPNYSQALKWARLECKSYKISEHEIEIISEPEIEPHIPEREIERRNGLDHDEELPLFLRSPRNN